MALSIGVTVGSKINVGGHRVLVKELINPGLIVITVDSGDEIVVSENSKVEILPGVEVQTGAGNGKNRRLAFHAHKSIRISRVEGPERR
jgi:hypothetical protein